MNLLTFPEQGSAPVLLLNHLHKSPGKLGIQVWPILPFRGSSRSMGAHAEVWLRDRFRLLLLVLDASHMASAERHRRAHSNRGMIEDRLGRNL